MEGLSFIKAPLIWLTHLDAPFEWSYECELSFQKLKEFLIIDLVLTLLVKGGGFNVCCDASDFCLGCIMM